MPWTNSAESAAGMKSLWILNESQLYIVFKLLLSEDIFQLKINYEILVYMNDQLKISSGATLASMRVLLYFYLLFDYLIGAAVWAPSTRLGKVDRGWLVPKKTGYCRSPPWSWASSERLVPKKQRPGGVGQVQSDLFQRNNDRYSKSTEAMIWYWTESQFSRLQTNADGDPNSNSP